MCKTFQAQFASLRLDKKPKSPKLKGMQENSYPMEVDVATAAMEFANGASILDVREPVELSICKIEGSIEVPMNEIPSNLGKIPKAGMVLVLCHHGTRSATVTSFLRQNNFDNAVNVLGGIDAWAQAVDHQLARY